MSILSFSRLRLPVENQFRRWFGGRMPVADEIKFNQRSTYILPTRAGLLSIGVVIIMMIGATNYQNNLAFLLTFLLVGIILVCIVFTFKNLQGLRLMMASQGENFAGDPMSIVIRVYSQTGSTHSSIAIGVDKKSLYLIDVTELQGAEISLIVEGSQRGYWLLPRFVATSKFPFGWFKTWAYFQFKTPLLIYPKAIEPPSYYAQAGGGDENEEGNKVSGNDDLYGLKPYQQGEPLARVDWKAYARERGMYIREFASYQSQQYCFDWQDFADCDVESRISYLTYRVLDASRQNLSYSLVLPNQVFSFNDGELHRKNCLQALALFGKEGD